MAAYCDRCGPPTRAKWRATFLFGAFDWCNHHWMEHGPAVLLNTAFRFHEPLDDDGNVKEAA